MATVTGMTSDKVTQLTDEAFVAAEIDGVTGALTFTKQNGATASPGVIPNTSTIIDAAYPVGSIFMSTSGVNPAANGWPGTWVAWGSGRVPVGVDTAQAEFDTAEEVGGEKAHTLSANEMPSHLHSMTHDHPTFATDGTDGGHGHALSFSVATGSTGQNVPLGTTTMDRTSSAAVVVGGTHSHTIDTPYFTGTTASQGGSAAHNNLQPYITCYMWKRTA